MTSFPIFQKMVGSGHADQPARRGARIDPRIDLGRASNLITLVVEALRAQKLYLVRQELSPTGEEDREGPTLFYA